MITTLFQLETLYKLDLNNSFRFWRISHILEEDEHYLFIEHGVDGGAIVSSKNKIVENNSGRSIKQQGELEARSRYKDKFREGYRPQGVIDSNDKIDRVEPMLANKWISKTEFDKRKKEYKSKVTLKDLSVGFKKASYPCGCQPKLDGIRAMARYNTDNTISLLSRGRNNEFAFLDHIKNELKEFYPYLPCDVIIDGELYKHDWKFEYLTSVVKTSKNKKNDNKEVEYHIFDFMDKSKPYSERHKILNEAYESYIKNNTETKLKIVEYVIVEKDEDVEECHKIYFEKGYEGVMIRDLKSKYTHGRSNNILKYKTFIDEETEVIGVENAKGTEEGKAILKVRDERGNEFSIRMRASFEERIKWLKDPSLVIGKNVTIRYQELSTYNVPRFPVGVAIRDYE